MKKVMLFILCLSMLFICACTKTPSLPVESPAEENVNSLPAVFSLYNVEISVEEIIEAVQLEFNDNGTKIMLTNKDGKYLVANYKIKNNESFDIDIDHSVEISVTDVYGKVHYGEYYEYETGKENIKINAGEEKMVSFVCDLETEEKPSILTFKYKDKVYEQKIEVE